jgi:hypothetical protein
VLKGIAVGGAGLAGLGKFSTTAAAQTPVPAPFCGEASTPPEQPPGGQAGQCINCVREVCDTEPVAVQLDSGLSGTSYVIDAEDIPDDADYLTLKAGQNCFLAEVPDGLSGEVSFNLQQVDGQPPMLQDISNATFYVCGDEEPPTANIVEVTCDEITIETTNIPNGQTLSVDVTFSNGDTQTYNPEVQNNQAIVDLSPGDRDPINVTVTFDGQILLDNVAVMAEDAPCGDDPIVIDYRVLCESVFLQTENIDEGEDIDVTVVFEDDSQIMETVQVDAQGEATVPLPGDQNPARLIVEFDETTILDDFVEAENAPCVKPQCPPGLHIGYKYKYGTWWPEPYDTIGEEVDPDVFDIEGNRKRVTICAPFPFAVDYALKKKGGKKKKYHDHDDKDGHDHDGKKDGKKKHHDHGPKCGHAKCEEQKPVMARRVNGEWCVTLPKRHDHDGGGCWCGGKHDEKNHDEKHGKKGKRKICWFRVFCPDENGNGRPPADS